MIANEILLSRQIDGLAQLPVGTINIGVPLRSGAMQVGINCERVDTFDGFGGLIVSKRPSGLVVLMRDGEHPLHAQIVDKTYELDANATTAQYVTREDVFDRPVDMLELEPASTIDGEPAWLARADTLAVSRLGGLQYFCGIVGSYALLRAQKQLNLEG